uniref:Uncharacterized protein n=1 Tax=Phakopsora pachyrhizi TaxID=170000 RepID=A0A0S1MKF0_PHAPC
MMFKGIDPSFLGLILHSLYPGVHPVLSTPAPTPCSYFPLSEAFFFNKKGQLQYYNN